MNKYNVRSFALGILFATMIFTGGYYFLEIRNDGDKSSTTVEIPNEEWANLKETLTKTESELNKLQEKLENKGKEEAENQPNKEDVSQTPMTENEDETFTLVIKDGMNSFDIARILNEAHIVDDGTTFQNYLVEHGYDRKIQIGEFPIKQGMTYEEIGELITK